MRECSPLVVVFALSLSLSLSRLVVSQEATFAERSLESFRGANLDSVESVHCSVYETDSSNAQAAFGCFFAKTLRLFESRPITDFLAALGEPAINFQRDILDPLNPNALCTKMASSADESYYLEYPSLPFNSYNFAESSIAAFGRELLKRVRNNRVPFLRLQNDLFDLDGRLTELIDLLAVPKNMAEFSFTIPREICPVTEAMEDIVVNGIDVEGFHAILGSIRIFVNLLHSYTIGLVPWRFVREDGTIIRRGFVNDANGVGGDRKKFVELISRRGNLSALQPLLQSTLDSLILLLSSVDSTSDSPVFGQLLLSHRRDYFQTLRRYAQDLRDSLDNPDSFWPMTEAGFEDVEIDVATFLRALPDPRRIRREDPFVLGRNGNIQIVTSFFRMLFTRFARF